MGADINYKAGKYQDLESIFIEMIPMIRPPEKISVSDAAARHRIVYEPGAYVGPWLNDTTPYMVKPMNDFLDRDISTMAFVGPAQSGKALAIDTPIATPDGWTTMGELRPGDVVFSADGSQTVVEFVTKHMHDHECYRVTFDDGAEIVADADHKWLVSIVGAGADHVMTTVEILASHHFNNGDGYHKFIIEACLPLKCDHSVFNGDEADKYHAQGLTLKGGRWDTWGRRITCIEPVESVPVCCIRVNHLSHLFLAGRQMIPTHNTDSLIINTVAYAAKFDSMDMMVLCPTTAAARDFSIRRIDRLHHHSPDIGEMLIKTRDADNRSDKRYKSGMMLSITHPSPTELAGRPIGRVVLTDYDRIPDDVGEGSAFDLASHRTTTFGSLGITLAESSPSRDIEDPRWIPTTEHEAPPCRGIIDLYNRGDRHRWYWPCPHCEKMFEGEFKYLVWDEVDKDGNALTNLEKSQTAHMACPHCGALIHPDERYEMNAWGNWVPDGMYYDHEGRLVGKPPRSMMRSFWLKGVAAAFTNWRKLVAEYLSAEESYQRTGSEEALKKFYNNSLGVPYLPKSMSSIRTPEALQSKAENLPPKHVPKGVRFLVAAVDVQKTRFVVNVWGIMPGAPFDMVAIDAFELFLSERTDDNHNRLPVDPAANVDDWDVLKNEVMALRYPLEGDTEGKMAIRLTLCDSGGATGVTTNAYNFYRKLKDANAHGRFLLVKGNGRPSAPRVAITHPDSNRRDRFAGARGDVPVLSINSNLLKDTFDGRLDCTVPGSGMVRYPDWLPKEWFMEMCAESRGPKGWTNPNSERNEAWDLGCYVIAGCISTYLNVEMVDWNKAPKWAAEWDENNLITYDEKPAFAPKKVRKYDYTKLAQELA